MTTVKVAVATKTTEKVSGVIGAFKRYFSSICLDTYTVESEVPEQPVNMEVYKGAENRLDNLKKIAEADYYVAVESGLLNQYDNWFNVQVVLVENKEGKRNFGISQGFSIPKELIPEVLKTSLSQVMDKRFKGKGGTRVLTKGQVTRSDLVEAGTVMALTRFLVDW